MIVVMKSWRLNKREAVVLDIVTEIFIYRCIFFIQLDSSRYIYILWILEKDVNCIGYEVAVVKKLHYTFVTGILIYKLMRT